MRILHIGDFHYKSKTKDFNQEKIIEKLITHLKLKDRIDFVFFSGDLVFSGSNISEFEKANDVIFNPLAAQLKIDPANIIISPGNHDVNRNESSEALGFFFNSRENMGTNEKVNDLYSKKGKDYLSSISPIGNYTNFVQNRFCREGDICEPLYSIHKRNFGDKKIGVVTINTSWLSYGKFDDKNNLLFPTQIISETLAEIKDCDIKILIKHHPLHYFKEFNFIELQNQIHQGFDLMFSGHLHKEENATLYNGSNGIYCNVTQASLTYDKDGDIGYSIVNVDFEEPENLVIDKGTFIKSQNEFVDLESVDVTMPSGVVKQKQNRFRKKINEKFNLELENANQLLLNYSSEGFMQNFNDTFTEPILSKQSEAEETTKDNSTSIKFDDLVTGENNFLIFGKDKCGKTSLLRRIQLIQLKNYSFSGKIPFYFDYKEWENKTNEINLLRIIAQYYQINNKDTIDLLKSNRFVFLIDNLNILSPLHNNVLDFIIKNSPRFIFCSESITSRFYSTGILDDLQYERIFFRDLSRNAIRLYTEKIHSVQEEHKDEVVDKITKFCSQLKLPLNFWTISIFLVIFKKSNDDYSKNLFAILDSCVDEILQKKKLAFQKGGLDFDQYKEVCSQIAIYLLKEHKSTVYSATAPHLINFIDEYKKKNRRIVGDAKDIFDFLFECGIFKRKEDNYTFRLNGVFEYFLAYFLNDHPDYFDEILNNDSIYLSFKNELEIYSGFNRKNENLLVRVFNKTKDKLEPIINIYKTVGEIDDILDLKLNRARDFSDTVRHLVVKNPLSNQIKDQINDDLNPIVSDSDVQLKEYIDTEEINFELLEKYILILSRVFKNTDRILNHELVNNAFDFILEAYCYLGYYLIDEFEDYAKTENLKQTSEELDDNIIGENIIKMISNFIPLLVQAMLYDGVGHINLKEIINQKIEDLLNNKKANQYKLYLLYFLLIDIDINQKHLIDKVFEHVNKSALKVSTVLKLNYYLAFKGYKNKTLEQFFRNKIQTAQLRLDGKTDIGEIQRLLSQKSKKNIVKKQRDN
jgi:predicted MPP superfamily phosphohydrolase